MLPLNGREAREVGRLQWMGRRKCFLASLSRLSRPPVFLVPRHFIKGDTGQVLRVIPVVMLGVPAVSLIEAFLVLPNHLLHVIDKSGSG